MESVNIYPTLKFSYPLASNFTSKNLFLLVCLDTHRLFVLMPFVMPFATVGGIRSPGGWLNEQEYFHVMKYHCIHYKKKKVLSVSIWTGFKYVLFKVKMKIRYWTVRMMFYHLCKNKSTCTSRNWTQVTPGTVLQLRDGRRTYFLLYTLCSFMILCLWALFLYYFVLFYL